MTNSTAQIKSTSWGTYAREFQMTVPKSQSRESDPIARSTKCKPWLHRDLKFYSTRTGDWGKCERTSKAKKAKRQQSRKRRLPKFEFCQNERKANRSCRILVNPETGKSGKTSQWSIQAPRAIAIGPKHLGSGSQEKTK